MPHFMSHEDRQQRQREGQALEESRRILKGIGQSDLTIPGSSQKTDMKEKTGDESRQNSCRQEESCQSN